MQKTKRLVLCICGVYAMALSSCGGNGGGAGGNGGGGSGGGTENEAPVASSGTLQTQRDTPADGMLEATDSEGDPLTFTIVDDGALGTALITDAELGTYTYTPNQGATGRDSFTFVANDGSADSNTAIITVTIAPPPTATIRTIGGRGGVDGFQGGTGGSIEIRKRGGSGNIEIRKDGLVDANFIPANPAGNLGSVPLVIVSDTSVEVVTSAPPEGTPYLIEGINRIYVSDGDLDVADEPPVTGLSVAPGVVVTLGLNSGDDRAELLLTNDLLNEGTIATEDETPSRRGSLAIDLASYIGSGAIRTNGVVEGQSGGSVLIVARFPIVNQGPINSSGADDTARPAGHGANVNLQGSAVDNTGDIDASGGSSGADAGGGGALISLRGLRGVRNSGNLTARGGDGAVGGPGGLVRCQIEGPFAETGDILNSGDIDLRGGVGSASSGGGGGSVSFFLYGSSLRTNGEINASGGDGGSDGGMGGSVDLVIENGGRGPLGPVPVGDVEVSGNIYASGGDARNGGPGSGGRGRGLTIRTGFAFPEPIPDRQQRIVLLGYETIDTRGGAGSFGAWGGNVVVENAASQGPSGEIPSGAVINEADIHTSGGDALADADLGTAPPACGGFISFVTQLDPGAASNTNDVTVENSGDLTTRSGNGVNWGGPLTCAGRVELRGFDGVSNTGNIDTSGGDDSGNAVVEGAATGSPIFFTASGPIANSGELKTDGGSGTLIGADAAPVEIRGSEVVNSGPISCRGGDADPLIEGSLGGAGGVVELFGSNGLGSVDNSAAVSIEGGAGSEPGEDGRYIEDGFCVAGSC